MRDQTAKCEATPKKHMLHAIKPYNDSTNAQCMIIYKGTTTGRPRTMTLCRHGKKDCGLTPAKRRAANSAAGLRGRSRGCAPAHLSVLVPMTSEGRRVSPPSEGWRWAQSLMVGGMSLKTPRLTCCRVASLMNHHASMHPCMCGSGSSNARLWRFADVLRPCVRIN